MRKYILVINPGSTSTKIGIFKGKNKKIEKKIEHARLDIEKFSKVLHQHSYRMKLVEKVLTEENIKLNELRAIASRGGLLRPIPAGVYKVTECMTKDLKRAIGGEHASNLGAIIAKELGDRENIESFIVDPVSVDEFKNIARISGIPEIERKSLLHALNIRAISYKIAEEIDVKLERLNLITAHLGGGISVAAIEKGKIVDVNNANEMGPFSPERSGELPARALVDICFLGKYTKSEMQKKLLKESGLTAYLMTNDLIEVEDRINNGDEYARLIYEAMAYQIAKEIGKMSTVLRGNIDYIIITGGMAKSNMLIDYIRKMTDFIAPFKVHPGEDELEALNSGVIRVLEGREKIKIYEDEV